MPGLDDTDQEEASVGKHLAGMRERLAEAEEADEVSVETPEVDEADDEESEVAAPTRQDKRAGRQTARERAAAAEAETKVLREQLEQSRRPQPGTRQEPTVSTADVDKRIADTYTELEALEGEYLRAQTNKTLTPAMEREMRSKAQELEIRKLELAAERREVRTAPRRQQDELTRQLARENSDVYDNPKAARYAYGRAQQLLAMGRADDKALHDEVMEETRRAILGKRDKPGAIEKQRATGMSAGTRSAPGAVSRTINMPKGSEYYKMAIAWAAATNQDLSASQACQKWAQTVGKKMLAKG